MPRVYRTRKGQLETFSVIDYKAFKHYRENSKFRNEDTTPNYVEHGKILSKFYDKIGQKIVASTGGVFIEGMGYFGAVINPVIHITSYYGQEKLMINKSTSGYSYYLAFIPIGTDSILREWVADNSFSSKVRKNFSKSLKEGKKYSFNFTSFLKMHGKQRKNQIV